MKAISIQQPWAHAILNLGKDIENRTWQTKHRGVILLHAGRKFDLEGHHYLGAEHGDPAERFHASRGGIVGIAILSEIVTESDSKWFFGPFGWVLEHAETLPFSPLKGHLGVFEAETDKLLLGTALEMFGYELSHKEQIAVAERPRE